MIVNVNTESPTAKRLAQEARAAAGWHGEQAGYRAARPFQVVYADPPWQYRDRAVSGKRGAGFKYAQMTRAAIQALPVGVVAAPASVCFLWVPGPLLSDGLEVLAAWGFKYRTVAFTWVKTTRVAPVLFMGMGNWTRANAELCLLGVRGRPRRVSAGVHSVVVAPVGAHSAKPVVVRDRIVELMGDVPRVELFARTAGPGWAVWGNEVESDPWVEGVMRGACTTEGTEGTEEE